MGDHGKELRETLKIKDQDRVNLLDNYHRPSLGQK